MPLFAASQHPRSPFAGAAPLAHRPLSAIAATAAGGVPQARIKRLLGELVPQLASVHEQGHICGDITVDSVGLDESGRAHLLALNGAAQGEAALPAPGYAPFELYVEDPAWPRGPWTDIYALSAVAHSLITGRRPPAAPERSVNDGYQPLAQRDLPKYDNDFLRAIDAGLAVRPHTFEAFVDSLKFPEPEPPAEAMAPLPSEPPPRDEVHDEEPVRQRPAVRSILFAILLALATLGVAVYWWQRLTGTPSGVITSSERVTTPGATATPSDSREAEPPAAGASTGWSGRRSRARCCAGGRCNRRAGRIRGRRDAGTGRCPRDGTHQRAAVGRDLDQWRAAWCQPAHEGIAPGAGTLLGRRAQCRPAAVSGHALGQGGPAGSHHARVPVSVRMALSQGVGWPAGAARR